ncbi:NADP-dependent oxidoreductase [Hyalangium rubrum]|uniref:NADP-dependent oxidoreductase n=1 Tax=Hyalangium rubrum TaxID=3103134 RepID=A0ABU5HB09_9BACT|nr:NADP-dependent oxidoreductase [Hyalangium sp. s54d21]MDY7230302.1 NADP-dependent oxidoreductase [Hyalangium sp. s54d21]
MLGLWLAGCSAALPESLAPPAPERMKAVRIHAYGGLDVLRYEDAPRPSPRPDEVLIRVHAAGVNPVDVAVRQGYMRSVLWNTLPLTLGWDVAGVVEQVGSQVGRFKPGDAVFAYADPRRDGAFAEYIALPERVVALKPQTLDFVQAAAVPLTALTSWQALVQRAELSAGQTVLIHGGSGGVGTMAVQLAKARGAKVIATGSAHNLDYLKSLGADEVIDYRATRFEDVVKDVDVVLDPIAGETQERSWQVLKKGGILVSLLNPSVVERAKAHGVRGAWFITEPSAEQLTELGRLIDAGQLRPVVSEVLSLRDIRRAQELIQSKHTRGKIVLRITE